MGEWHEQVPTPVAPGRVYSRTPFASGAKRYQSDGGEWLDESAGRRGVGASTRLDQGSWIVDTICRNVGVLLPNAAAGAVNVKT